MQASKMDVKSSWKQSVIKNIAAQSQILAEAKDLPSKFTPLRSNLLSNSNNSLIRPKRNHSNSQDDIAINDNHDHSISKDKGVQKRESLKQKRSGSGNDNSFIGKHRDKSQKSMEFTREKGVTFKPDLNIIKDFDLVRELKVEFLRFKDKILKELKKQEDDIKKAVEEIYQLINSKKVIFSPPFNENENDFRRDTVTKVTASMPSINFNPSKINQITSSISNNPSVQINNKPLKDIQQYRQQFSSDKHGYVTSIPQIRQQMSRFHSIIDQLKKDIGDQIFPNESSRPNESQVQ